MKRILDSVHGYIQIDDDYCNNIIDTEYFQRLRRIEQTSTRSIFPSARHDRFIHSLGVFHLGCMFVEKIEKQISELASDKIPSNKDNVFESYKLACLLHDVAHSLTLLRIILIILGLILEEHCVVWSVRNHSKMIGMS